MKYTNSSKHTFSFFSLLIILLTMSACASQKVTPLEDLPEWAKGTPTDSEYYMGVGHSYITPHSITFKDKAKKKALQEIAQAISYQVKATSILINDARDNQTNTTFANIVRLNINAQLEGYEVAEIFENEIDYYVLYRLSKVKYAQQLEAKKQKAIAQATEKFQEAKSLEKQYDYYHAIIKYAQVIDALKNYYAENPTLQLQGAEYSGIDYSFKQIQNILQRLKLQPFKQSINTRFGSQIYEYGTSLTAENVAIQNFPIKAKFSTSSSKEIQTTTRTNGKAYFNHLVINSWQREEQIQYHLDLEAILKEAKVDFNIRQWLLNLETPHNKTRVHILPARIHFTTIKNIDNKPLENSADPAIVELFTQKGFIQVDNKQEADYFVELTGNSKRASSQNGTYTSQLSGFFILKNASRNICFEKQFYNIKGRQLSYFKAGQNAYGQLTQQIKNDWMDSIIQSMLKK